MKIYHNPRCSKSRETLRIIREHGIEPEVIEYLKTPPTKAELEQLLVKLHLSVKDLLRTDEKLFKEKYKGLNFTDEEWIMVMVENPQLIQRPVVVKNNKAVIARPPENVKDLF